MAVKEDFSHEEWKLLHICEARYALETEGYNIAFIRLFEAYSSENHLNEPTAKLVFEMAGIAQNLREVNAGTLILNFPFAQKSRKDHVQIPLLKKEINQYLDEALTTDSLLYLGILNGYIALHKRDLKCQLSLANTITNQWMKENNLLQLPLLPLAGIIRSNLKMAEELLQEGFETGALQEWILYFIECMRMAAFVRTEQLKSIIQLKKSTRDIIAKYTPYALAADELLPILFERPFVKAKDIIDRIGCHRQTAYAYLSHLEKAGILIEMKSGREKLYFHKRLFEVLIT